MGPTGQKGERGEMGRAGDRGERGERGHQGIQGLLGSRGQIGPTGAPRHPGHNIKGQKGEPGSQGTPGGIANCGQTYVRWGRTVCPHNQGKQLVYSGRAGGSWYNSGGGATNYVCMPDNQDYLQNDSSVQGHNYIYGVEYWWAKDFYGCIF